MTSTDTPETIASLTSKVARLQRDNEDLTRLNLEITLARGATLHTSEELKKRIETLENEHLIVCTGLTVLAQAIQRVVQDPGSFTGYTKEETSILDGASRIAAQTILRSRGVTG